MTSPIDVVHLGHERVIAAYEPRPGVVVDPGPSTSVETMLAGLRAEPRVLCLTHIHLDHAGAAGSLVRRFPALRVCVHASGAPHLADPRKLLASAGRLYGDEMARLWGEVAPVPAENLEPLSGGERIEGLDVVHVPGHAGHHVAYIDAASGEAFVGDVAGVRIAPNSHTIAPTPPPEIDVEAWRRSLDALAGIRPTRLCLTHFGVAGDAAAQLDRARDALDEAADRARHRSRADFESWMQGAAGRAAGDDAALYAQAAPVDHCWLGLERYWRKRGGE